MKSDTSVSNHCHPRHVKREGPKMRKMEGELAILPSTKIGRGREAAV